MGAAVTAEGLPDRLGKYDLVMPLAAGGMARIYIGRSSGIGLFERHVVLKIIMPERANDLTAVHMFLDEARLAASLNHQNVAQVFEVGQESGLHFLAMEYVHGQDLRAVLSKAGSSGTRIPLELALTVVAGAAAGLHHAHERRGADGVPLGIVHRDVSPSNIMLGYDGAVKLLDFGIAKAAQRSVETQSGIIKGKFAYMSPEQCRGREVDRRSDVFSLGIILYEVTTQHRCFRADSDFDTMHRIVTGDVVRPSRLVQGYPPALEAVVMKALAVDPAQRYQSAGQLLEALESLAVSARMSLSTMSLGRFMRDMFGDVQEPWLDTSLRSHAPVEVRETTISSTGGQQSLELAALGSDASYGIPDGGDFEPFVNDDGEAAATLLEMPHGAPAAAAANAPGWGGAFERDVPGEAAGAQWPASGASPGGGHRGAPGASHPGLAGDSGQMGQMGQMGSSGGSPAFVVTKHGYASAAATNGDPRMATYAPGALATMDVRMQPNRRPLYIGLALSIVGAAAIVFVSMGGSSSSDPADGTSPFDAQGSAEERSTDPGATPGGDEASPPDGSGREVGGRQVSIVVQSDPPGADVLVAGTKIGVTPLDTKLRRGVRGTRLVVRKDGYAAFVGEVDLSGDYQIRSIKLTRTEEPRRVTGGGRGGRPVAPAPKPVKCQLPGPNVDPFGPPICKN